MSRISTALMLSAALAVSACANADRFNGMGDGSNAGLNNGSLSNAPVPGSAQDPRSPAYFQQTVGDRVLFLIDQSTLTPEGRATLDGQAQWLQTNSDYLAVIEGHADEQGTREYNLALGARRASAVQQYLISKGISPSRLKFVSYGKERPIAICSEEACYAKNRRAVTIISAGLTS
ncbi:peptidoglycan-associated lipoprotein Pal [Primorskyibacter flagellatus]|uniref:Peptidoglycan-associated lipoprotein n=1 Tax=Primorskyibacter flagellatus TaxID=1387277 RepID=A0A1W2C7Y9_9RHOB|nr:peptidoglycan-associated lipoprotein Pal [Primorskyibacter flagellatus]SMC80972.1 peptidoglycan-associated lipoprotein [Primorskyibacter flagellatus]